MAPVHIRLSLNCHDCINLSTGCERDERGRYCGNIVHTSEFETLVDRAILACEGTDCTRGICEAAIDEVRGHSYW